MAEPTDSIRTFIVDNFLFGEDPGLELSESLLASGTVDSTGVLELILFLENTYGISIGDEELIPENLDTIERLAAYVERKRAPVKPGVQEAQEARR